jgi:DNA-directed RNA polymerase subunit RPC12/RpoP
MWVFYAATNMKKLIKCSACDREISPNAARCPNCGERTANSKRVIAMIVIIIIALLIGWFINEMDKAQRRTIDTIQRYR